MKVIKPIIFKGFYRAALDKVAQLNFYVNNPDWSHLEDTNMPAVISYTDKFDEKGVRAFKAEFFIYTDIKTVSFISQKFKDL